METKIFEQLLGNGVLGLLVAILLYAYWKKDKELREESKLRIDDAKAMTTVVTGIQEKVIHAVTKLGEIHEAYEDERKQSREALRRTGA